MQPKSAVRRVAFLVAGLLIAASANAAEFPAPGKSITIMVPYSAGGTTDATARLMAAGLEKELGTTVQVVNKPGAASQVAMTALLASRPDGYTLSYAVLPTVITHYKDPGRDPAPYARANFKKVALHFAVPVMIAVMADSPYISLKDLVEAAKANPQTIKISDSGLMATPHLGVLMLEHATGAKFASVHFKGGAPSVTALLGNHVDALTGGVSDAVPNFKAGKFRVLGVADDKPSQFLPGVPTMKSQGFDVMTFSATGILAPEGTPDDVVAVLTNAMKKVIADPAHQERLSQIGATPRYLGPEEYDAFWADYESRVEPVLKAIRSQQ